MKRKDRMEQRALIARVQAGDRSAFADLTSRYRDMAFGYALALLQDFHFAQDVTQEAFLTAYLNLGKLQDPEAFPRWLQGIVRHHCHRVLRKRHLDLVPLEEGIGVPAMAKGPEQHLEERERRSTAFWRRSWPCRGPA